MILLHITCLIKTFSNLDDNDENEEDDGEDDDGDLNTSPSDQACKFLKVISHLHITCNMI